MTSSIAEPQLLPPRLALSRWMRAEGFALWFPLSAFFVTRAVNALMFALASGRQIAIPSTGLGGKLAITSPAAPGYWVEASNWDGRWYGAIASYGYPEQLPVDSAGHVLQNAYAFPPLYPMLVRLVMLATGLDFAKAGPVVSLACGAGAMILMYRLVANSAGRRAGALTVLLVCTFMSAPVFQMSYSEGLTLLLVCGALTFLTRRRYELVALTLLLLSLTRPVGPAVALVVLVHGLTRYRHRSVERFTLRDRLRVFGVAGVGVLLAGLWPLGAALMTGRPNAYFESMAAWSPGQSLRVLMAWPSSLWKQGGTLGLMALLLLVVACTWLVRRRGAHQWTVEVRAWAWAYPLFLFFATGPGASSLRYGVLAFPLIWPFVERSDTEGDRTVQTAYALCLAALGLVAQWVWISTYVIVTAHSDVTFP